jgi:ribosome assembly protein 1
VEETTVHADKEEDLQIARTKNFEVISAVQNAIREGFLDWSPRLMLAMYSCDVQSSSKCPPGVMRGRLLTE